MTQNSKVLSMLGLAAKAGKVASGEFSTFATKEELGHWIGKAYRASICILDEGFAKSIVKKISLNMEG